MSTFCPACGVPATEDSAFCAECGTAVSTAPGDDQAGTRLGGTPVLVSDTHNAPPAAATMLPDIHGTMTAGAGRSGGGGAYAPPSSPYGHPAPPVYPAPAHGPAQGGAGKRALIGVAAAALVIAGFVGATQVMNGKSEPQTVAAQPTPVASTPTSTAPVAPSTQPAGAAGGATNGAVSGVAQAPQPTGVDPAPQQEAPLEEPAGRPGEGAGANYRMHFTASGMGGTFDRAGTLTSSTTEQFMHAVARAYAESGAGGASTTLFGVYSPVTQKSYTMTCGAQDSGAVVCSGGNNAKVVLYN